MNPRRTRNRQNGNGERRAQPVSSDDHIKTIAEGQYADMIKWGASKEQAEFSAQLTVKSLQEFKKMTGS